MAIIWLRLRSAFSPRWLSEVEARLNSFRIAILLWNLCFYCKIGSLIPSIMKSEINLPVIGAKRIPLR